MHPCLVKSCPSHERTYQVPVGNRKFWLANLGILWVNSRNRICAKHFREECFLKYGKLRLGSLPTENIGREALYQPEFSKHQKRNIEKMKRMKNNEAEQFELNKYKFEDPWDEPVENFDQVSKSVDAAPHSQSESSLILCLEHRNNELRAVAECLRLENTQLRRENAALKRSFEIHKCMLE